MRLKATAKVSLTNWDIYVQKETQGCGNRQSYRTLSY